MAVITCPCCGAGIADRTVLTRVQQRIYDSVRRHPALTGRELMRYVYADDPDGGPLSPKIISIHIIAINKRLAPQGLAICNRRGSGDGYKLIKLESK